MEAERVSRERRRLTAEQEGVSGFIAIQSKVFKCQVYQEGISAMGGDTYVCVCMSASVCVPFNLVGLWIPHLASPQEQHIFPVSSNLKH